MKINCYVIVKKSNYAYYNFATPKAKKLLTIKGKLYTGIGRMFGYDIDNNAPSDIKLKVNFAQANYSLSLRYDMFFERSSALDVLNYLNMLSDQKVYEIIAIYSKFLCEFNPPFEDEMLEKLGVDIDDDGLWPIKEALFASQLNGSIKKILTPFFKLLNQNGLFNNLREAKNFVSTYDINQDLEGLENLNSLNADYLYLYKLSESICTSQPYVNKMGS